MNNELKKIFEELSNKKEPVHICVEGVDEEKRKEIILSLKKEQLNLVCVVIDKSIINDIKTEFGCSSVSVIGSEELLQSNTVLENVDVLIIYDAEQLVFRYKKYRKTALKLQKCIEAYSGYVFWYTKIHLKFRLMLKFTGAHNVREVVMASNGSGLVGIIDSKSQIEFWESKNARKFMSELFSRENTVLVVSNGDSALMSNAIFEGKNRKKGSLEVVRCEELLRNKNRYYDVNTIIVDYMDVLCVSQILEKALHKGKKIHLCICIDRPKIGRAKSKLHDIKNKIKLYRTDCKKYIEDYGIGDDDSSGLTYVRIEGEDLRPALNLWTVSYYEYLGQTGYISEKRYRASVCKILGIKESAMIEDNLKSV